MFFHQACDDARVARWEARRKEEEAARELKGRVLRLKTSFCKSCVGYEIGRKHTAGLDSGGGWLLAGGEEVTRSVFPGPLCFPVWDYARLANLEFRRRVSPLLLNEVEGFDHCRDGSLVLLGETGKGKSALTVAYVHRRYDDEMRRVEAGESRAIHFAWVSGFELAGARKRSPLGGESPLVQHAIEIPLLILDEVGHEPQSEELMLVIDGRYRANLPTILTSPLTWQELAQHIGGGAYRRLLEHGIKADAHGEVTKGQVRVVR
jgi:hypothetical protein